MEEDKLLDALKNVRKEMNGLRKELRKSRLTSRFFFTIPLGLAIFLYFTNMLNEALNAKAIEWVAWLGIIAGIFMMMFPSIVNSTGNRRRE